METKKELFAWVTQANGKDSLVGTIILGCHTPLIATSRDLVEQLRPVAVAHTRELRQPLRLVRYTEAETLERYEVGKKMAAH